MQFDRYKLTTYLTHSNYDVFLICSNHFAANAPAVTIQTQPRPQGPIKYGLVHIVYTCAELISNNLLCGHFTEACTV